MARNIQIKVCGLTDARTAAACEALKIEALGLVFYPRSPRFVTDAQAEAIAAVLKRQTAVVGVFVDERTEEVAKKAKRCGLTAVQLHGRETPAAVEQLRNEGLTVIKALFLEREPRFNEAPRYNPSAFLLECGAGRLPGGTAKTWDWSAAETLAAHVPVILAGGLTPENVGQAVLLGRPQAVDVSSGVEASPGNKDLAKIEAFVAAVDGIDPADGKEETRRIFQ